MTSTASFTPDLLQQILRDPDRSPKQIEVALDDRIIHLRFHPARTQTKSLVIGFHGAIDRATRVPPIFLPPLPDVDVYAHQLMVSDPSLDRGNEFVLSWYAGDQGLSVQTVLATLLAEAVSELEATRVVCFGTSGGGFAGLYYGWHLPGSVVLVGNPQTNLFSYHRKHVSAYLECCWQQQGGIDLPRGEPCLDLSSLYSQTVPCTVLFFQNPTDQFHLYQQALPFVGRIKTADRSRVLLQVLTSGKIGHTPDWPSYAPWLYAACTADNASVADIVAARFRGTQPVPESPSARTDSHKPSERDLHLAARLQALVLSQD